MKNKLKSLGLVLLALVFILTACGLENLDLVMEEESSQLDLIDKSEESLVVKEGHYSDKDQVAAYIREFGSLPSNYISKKEAKKLGWDPAKKNLWQVTDGKSIGGDRFMNFEEKLPMEKGRLYYECDIDYQGLARGAKRLVYSNDGLIYYTEDHYNTFINLD